MVAMPPAAQVTEFSNTSIVLDAVEQVDIWLRRYSR
jgi:hypothetical protein